MGVFYIFGGVKLKKLGLNEIRQKFLDFFESKSHYIYPSYSLVPEKDKSLLLINAGMVPLKPYYMGSEKPPAKRMATCQKCIRTGDIDHVGHTARHGTFFEMLGNFSFGDYFKEESISWGWEFVTKHLNMPIDKLWVTIYEKDEEAYDIWKNKIGIAPEKIVRLGKEDNFWEIGVGPCGPCSEIYFDRGEKFGCNNPDCKPGCECDRYIEFWNHVFTQYNKDEKGQYTPLPNPNIDTGMGLERISCILQNVDSIFEVDTISYILKSIADIAGLQYTSDNEPQNVSIRVITDHIRSVTFLVSDSVLPSNEGRGYVLRRLLRRAARHGKLIGIKETCLSELSEKVIEVSKGAYPELEERKDYIKKVISIEEERFQETIDQGTQILNEYMSELKQSSDIILSGEKAFKLYDTFGFPLELTEEILKEKGYSVNTEDFNTYMEKQKSMSRSAQKSESDLGWDDKSLIDFDKIDQTVFTGYDVLVDESKVQLIIGENGELATAKEGQKVKIILDKTPFYAESGGQVGDKGRLFNSKGTLDVINCEKTKNIHIHECIVKDGIVEKNTKITAEVNKILRNATAKNHTATHLLHKALKDILGSHVEQAGSLVTKDRLRFDFTHFETISQEALDKIEANVNDKIAENLPVTVEETDLEKAIEKGAVALFGEKYEKKVRIIKAGHYSMELCGGTHVKDLGQIGAFKILNENSVAAGIRRIEAITGQGIYQYLLKKESVINHINDILKTNSNNILAKVENMNEELKIYKKELDDLKKELRNNSLDDILKSSKDVNGINLITYKFDDTDIKELRSITDDIKVKFQKSVIVFASVNDGKVVFLVSVTDDLLDKVHAGKLIKEIAAVAGGGGGGKADMAQAGAKDSSKVNDALMHAEKLLLNITI